MIDSMLLNVAALVCQPPRTLQHNPAADAESWAVAQSSNNVS